MFNCLIKQIAATTQNTVYIYIYNFIYIYIFIYILYLYIYIYIYLEIGVFKFTILKALYKLFTYLIFLTPLKKLYKDK